MNRFCSTSNYCNTCEKSCHHILFSMHIYSIKDSFSLQIYMPLLLVFPPNRVAESSRLTHIDLNDGHGSSVFLTPSRNRSSFPLPKAVCIKWFKANMDRMLPIKIKKQMKAMINKFRFKRVYLLYTLLRSLYAFIFC